MNLVKRKKCSLKMLFGNQIIAPGISDTFVWLGLAFSSKLMGYLGHTNTEMKYNGLGPSAETKVPKWILP